VVVNDERIVLGDLRDEALRAEPGARVEQVMNPAPSTYRPNVSVHEMAHHLKQSGAERVLVADCDGRLIGVISRTQVEKADQEQQQQPQQPEQKRSRGPVLAS